MTVSFCCCIPTTPSPPALENGKHPLLKQVPLAVGVYDDFDYNEGYYSESYSSSNVGEQPQPQPTTTHDDSEKDRLKDYSKKFSTASGKHDIVQYLAEFVLEYMARQLTDGTTEEIINHLSTVLITGHEEGTLNAKTVSDLLCPFVKILRMDPLSMRNRSTLIRLLASAQASHL